MIRRPTVSPASKPRGRHASAPQGILVALLCVVGTALPSGALAGGPPAPTFTASPTLTPGPACVPSSVTGASLQIAGDDAYDVYVNGTQVSTCGTGPPTACESVSIISIPLGLINLPPADNVLALYVTDTGGVRSGVTYMMTLTFSDCPTQTFQSDGFCTRSVYAGNVNDGTTNFPPGWQNTNFNGNAWPG